MEALKKYADVRNRFDGTRAAVLELQRAQAALAEEAFFKAYGHQLEPRGDRR